MRSFTFPGDTLACGGQPVLTDVPGFNSQSANVAQSECMKRSSHRYPGRAEQHWWLRTQREEDHFWLGYKYGSTKIQNHGQHTGAMNEAEGNRSQERIMYTLWVRVSAHFTFNWDLITFLIDLFTFSVFLFVKILFPWLLFIEIFPIYVIVNVNVLFCFIRMNLVNC